MTDVKLFFFFFLLTLLLRYKHIILCCLDAHLNELHNNTQLFMFMSTDPLSPCFCLLLHSSLAEKCHKDNMGSAGPPCWKHQTQCGQTGCQLVAEQHTQHQLRTH